jgi:tRNA(fMet)-specific endonuclease VapC
VTYCLDTNTCIYYLTGRKPAVKERLLAHSPGEILIPAIVEAELLYGAERSRRRDYNTSAVREFLLPFSTAAFGSAAAQVYARMRADLERIGLPIGPNDLIIAAIAIATETTLVTHNVAEFSRVGELSLEDWTESPA